MSDTNSTVQGTALGTVERRRQEESGGGKGQRVCETSTELHICVNTGSRAQLFSNSSSGSPYGVIFIYFIFFTVEESTCIHADIRSALADPAGMKLKGHLVVALIYCSGSVTEQI